MPTMCQALFEESVWNIRINQSMTIKRDVFESRTPVVFFGDTKTVINVSKLKDNCKCSVLIFPEAHNVLRPKLLFSLSYFYKNTLFNKLKSWLSQI